MNLNSKYIPPELPLTEELLIKLVEKGEIDEVMKSRNATQFVAKWGEKEIVCLPGRKWYVRKQTTLFDFEVKK